MDIKWERNKKKNALLIGIVLAIAIIGILFWLNTDKNEVKAFKNEKAMYNADLEVKEALKRLKEDDKKAELITDINTADKKFALTFDGLSDAGTMKEILALLDKYDMKATFFVSGIQSAEDGETVLAITKAGQEIGSYSLSAKKHMEALSEEEIVKDLCRTNVILREITGKSRIS
ncbi:MAG: polysaccharide deacetylase family protein [Bacillota bacterium]